MHWLYVFYPAIVGGLSLTFFSAAVRHWEKPRQE
jgi:hypothetical protein